MGKYTAIGGQALIEGIMMKSPEKTALAVRKADQTIDVSYLDEDKKNAVISKIPVIRGVVTFVKSMIQGYKAMMLSAEISGFTDLDEDGDQPKTEQQEKKQNAILSAVMVIGTVLGVILAVALFMYLPRLAVGGLQKLFHTSFSRLLRSCLEQLIKLIVFVAYVWAVSLMKDIKRVFMYHGAEHKTIFCYEKGLPLTVENVRVQRRFHPRCGTSFLILMILISVIFSTVIQLIFRDVYNNALVWTLVKLLMIPLICGAGYELLRVCGKYDNLFTRIVSAPGMWLQRLTTKEPEDDMIEIAIAALRACEPENPDVDRSIDAETENAEESPEDIVNAIMKDVLDAPEEVDE